MLVTNRQITDLETEAGAAGDLEQVRLCQVARLGHSFCYNHGAAVEVPATDVERAEAQRKCERAILGAQAAREKNDFRKGDRVVWSAKFLAEGKLIDCLWYENAIKQIGTVEHVQRDGDIVVQWDDSDCTTVHPPSRLAFLLNGWTDVNRTIAP